MLDCLPCLHEYNAATRTTIQGSRNWEGLKNQIIMTTTFLDTAQGNSGQGLRKMKNNLCRDFEGICKLLICARPSSFAQSHCFICVVQLNSEVWPPQTLPWCHRFTMLFFLKCNQLVECGFMFFFLCMAPLRVSVKLFSRHTYFQVGVLNCVELHQHHALVAMLGTWKQLVPIIEASRVKGR